MPGSIVTAQPFRDVKASGVEESPAIGVRGADYSTLLAWAAPAHGGPLRRSLAHELLAVVIMQKIKIEQHSMAGTLWFGAWLFTIGFLQLTFWQGVLAILLWPYDLGVRFSSLLR